MSFSAAHVIEDPIMPKPAPSRSRHSQPAPGRTRIEWLNSHLLERGQASIYIEQFQVRPGDRFVLVLRVSSKKQADRHNLRAQETELREAVGSRGGIVIEVFHYVGQGHGDAWLDFLGGVAQFALQHDAILLATTTDRFIRHPDYRSNEHPHSQAQARIEDLEALHQATFGVRLMTLVDPDASPTDCSRSRAEWATKMRRNSGGRGNSNSGPGYRKRLRQRWLPYVLEQHSRGNSAHDIWLDINERIGPDASISYSTVCRWSENSLHAKE
jgi:hypothetical protein